MNVSGFFLTAARSPVDLLMPTPHKLEHVDSFIKHINGHLIYNKMHLAILSYKEIDILVL